MRREDIRSRYNEDGFFVERACLNEEDVEAMIVELERLWASIDKKNPPSWVHWRKNVANEDVQDRIDPICPQSELFDDYSQDPRIVDFVNDVFDGPSFVLKAKVIMKRPGTMGYGVHQDMPYWDSVGLNSNEVLTAAIALDHITAKHGPLELYGKLHKKRLPGAPENELDVDPQVLKSFSPEVITMAPGDIAFFDSLVPHSSGPNTAATSRRMFLITYAKEAHRKNEIIARYASQVEVTHAVHRVKP